MSAARDFSRLLASVPKGSWVAISHDEERVISYAADLLEALEKAREAGEKDPAVIRVPESDAVMLL